jgi:hypothetical protein
MFVSSSLAQLILNVHSDVLMLLTPLGELDRISMLLIIVLCLTHRLRSETLLYILMLSKLSNWIFH